MRMQKIFLLRPSSFIIFSTRRSKKKMTSDKPLDGRYARFHLFFLAAWIYPCDSRVHDKRSAAASNKVVIRVFI